MTMRSRFWCEKKFVVLRRQHSAVESEINSLEHHGLNRCLDLEID